MSKIATVLIGLLCAFMHEIFLYAYHLTGETTDLLAMVSLYGIAAVCTFVLLEKLVGSQALYRNMKWSSVLKLGINGSNACLVLGFLFYLNDAHPLRLVSLLGAACGWILITSVLFMAWKQEKAAMDELVETAQDYAQSFTRSYPP